MNKIVVNYDNDWCYLHIYESGKLIVKESYYFKALMNNLDLFVRKLHEYTQLGYEIVITYIGEKNA